MTDDDGKEPYPDDIETTDGWPDDDEELPVDEEENPKKAMEPYPEELRSDES